MPRLSDRAYQILAAEVERLCRDNPLEHVRRDIVLRRLQRFCATEGPPVTLNQLRDAILDIFPAFSDQVIRRALKANGTAATVRQVGLLGKAAIGAAMVVGGVWVLNLPYPMIRWPVARVAPILLLPSFISMDHNYRQTIDGVQQADQLINQATSAQDIALGAEKVAQAQKSLNKLPVWFLGYYPQRYCSFVTCQWRFTYDEFQTARESVARMEAKVFQEQNAQTLLTEGTAAVDTAKAAYQEAVSAQEKSQALAAWQAGMDKLNEIPPETLAGRSAQTKLQAYNRDYQQVAGVTAGNALTSNSVQAAESFAQQAIQVGLNPPHTPEIWQQAAGLWQSAIQRLEQVQRNDPDYIYAQDLLAQYQKNLGDIQVRLKREQDAIAVLNGINTRVIRLKQDSGSMTPAQMAVEIEAITQELRKVQPGTTVYTEAQELLTFANAKLAELNP